MLKYTVSNDLMFNRKQRNTIDLTIELVKTSFKMRYQNSVLGFLWVLIKPYAMFLVMYVIFANAERENVINFGVYLLCGVVFISFTNEMLSQGQMALLDRAHVILKVNFARQIAVMSSLISALINVFINVLLIIVIAALSGLNMSITAIGVILMVILIMFIWFLAISFLLSILTVRFRDLKNIIELGIFLLQYTTPIFYTLEDTFLPQKAREVVALNPLGFLINQMRGALGSYTGTYSQVDFIILGLYLFAGIVAAYIGWIYFAKNVKSIAEHF